MSEENCGRGRFIPWLPWEAIWNGVGEWWGLSDDERKEVGRKQRQPGAEQLPVDRHGGRVMRIPRQPPFYLPLLPHAANFPSGSTFTACVKFNSGHWRHARFTATTLCACRFFPTRPTSPPIESSLPGSYLKTSLGDYFECYTCDPARGLVSGHC